MKGKGFGFIERRECWRLTWRGTLAVFLLLIGLCFLTGRFVYPFLAITEPVPADVLVIEGWLAPNMLAQAVAAFRRGHYHRLILLRPIVGQSDNVEMDNYEGDYKTKVLLRYGVPKEEEITLSPLMAQKDRTYNSALSARQWLAEQGLKINALDVASSGPHSRRTRLMYEKAFGPGVKIGIIALVSPEYDPAHWWRSSEGVRETLGEIIAYIYAKFLFSPRN